MKTISRAKLFSLTGMATLVAATLGSTNATAADYALIMGIGNYQESRANLPGIDKDVAAARRIAQSIGVPPDNIRELFNDQVSTSGIEGAFSDLESRISQGDRVFVYYSGHGAQVPSGGARCTEALVAYNMQLYKDVDLESKLSRLASKAGQLVMFNDSCFSGGAATKSMPVTGRVAKMYVSKAVIDNPSYNCGDAVNMKSAARNLVASATTKGNNVVYVAAAADDEVAFATPNGSAATVAWEACLRNSSADTNGSGGLSAQELATCAQSQLQSQGFKQTITLVGNRNLPISFATSGSAPSSQTEGVRRSAATLEDIRQGASSAIQVELSASKQELRIGQEPLDFSVRSSRGGYLYLLHVGPDGKTFDLLFPNDLDQNNYVQPGTTRLPRPSWKVMAAGPVGDAHVMAIVSDAKKDLTKALASKQGPFSSAQIDSATQAKLQVFATGAGSSGATSQYGASTVVRVREVN